MLLLCSADAVAPQQQRRASTFRRRGGDSLGDFGPNVAEKEPRLAVVAIVTLRGAELLDTSTTDGQRRGAVVVITNSHSNHVVITS